MGTVKHGEQQMKVPSDYTAAHAALRVSARRYENSPFLDKYATDDMLYGIYARRLHVLSAGEDSVAHYWQLRRGVLLFDIPEKPLQIRGPDAVPLLEKVMCRRIGDLRPGRARYALACAPDGGVLMDGVLMRLAENHFWYVHADGEFETWLLAFAEAMDVEIRDPGSRVLQVQGPRSLDVMRAATNGQLTEAFRYFHVGRFDLGGQQLLISRTGWTGELGVEIYSEAGVTDHSALWDHLMAHGDADGLVFSGAASLNTRRIEAGILDNGTDMDRSMTPYAAGLGAFVDPDKPGFIGRGALASADRRCRLFGFKCADAVPLAECEVTEGRRVVGRMTIGTWSPALEAGIGYVRFDTPGDWLGKKLHLAARDGTLHEGEVVALPFYDPEKKIPRGLATEG